MQTAKTQTALTKEHLEKAFSYEQYRKIIDELLEQGKTTGENQSESLTEYTKMNVQRMKRWDKTAEITEEIINTVKNIDKTLFWVVLTEGWCGDAAQNIPILAKIAALNSKIQLKFLLRDENLALMDNYLTNGGRSIPKLIILNENLEELAVWGPRPAVLQEMVMAYKANPTEEYADFVAKLHKWYADDKNMAIQQEIATLLQQL